MFINMSVHLFNVSEFVLVELRIFILNFSGYAITFLTKSFFFFYGVELSRWVRATLLYKMLYT